MICIMKAAKRRPWTHLRPNPLGSSFISKSSWRSYHVNSQIFLLAGLALILYYCPSGQAVYLVSPSVRQLIKKESFPLDLTKTVLKFYQLDMNSEFWTRYVNKLGIFHGMISKKTLRWMKNQEDLALDVSKASVSQPSWSKSCLQMSIIYFWSICHWTTRENEFENISNLLVNYFVHKKVWNFSNYKREWWL